MTTNHEDSALEQAKFSKRVALALAIAEGHAALASDAANAATLAISERGTAKTCANAAIAQEAAAGAWGRLAEAFAALRLDAAADQIERVLEEVGLPYEGQER